MPNTKVIKQCGTCRHWQGDDCDDMRLCEWPTPKLPFWASISCGTDHDNWTSSDDGKTCKTYEIKDA
jgi:hypothetical protein